MPSDDRVGKLLRTLVRSKPGGSILELGTGMGLSLAWMVSGMDPAATIVSVDNDKRYFDFASGLFPDDDRVEVICADGGEWIENYAGPGFDLVFADTWAGKYTHLEETLSILRSAAIYIIDDMLPQKNWPEGHEAKARKLTETLLTRADLDVCQLDWASGVMLCTKRPD